MVRHAPCFVRSEGDVEIFRVVRAQVVEDDADLLGVGMVQVDEVPHALSEIDSGSLLGHLHMAPRMVGIDEDEQVRRAVAPVLVVVTMKAFRRRLNRNALVSDELDWRFVKADNRELSAWALGVEREDVLHPHLRTRRRPWGCTTSCVATA